MKRICFVAPSLQMGGIERAMTTLANYFVTKGHDVYYVSMFAFEHFFELDPRIKYFEPDIPYPKNKSKVDIVKYYIKVFFSNNGFLHKTLGNICPDVVISFGDWYPHLVMLSLKGKYPFYYANRSNPIIKYSKAVELIRSLAYKFYPPTGVIAQTELAKKRKMEIFGNNAPRIKVIHNPARRVRLYDDVERENYIIAVGRMLWSKGFGRAIDVFRQVDAPEWKLLLVGDGREMNQIKDKVKELGLDDRVVFTGKSDNVDKWLAKAKIYLMTSYREGFPNALCEAMAAGLACVSYDIVAGPSDIITDGVDGFLVTDGDVDAMVQKTQYLIDNPEEIVRVGNKAKEIVERLSIEKIGNEYLKFILNDE